MNSTTPSDSDVIAQLTPLRRYARTLSGDEGQAEDLVHDTLVRAYERRSTFRPGANLRNWLLSILHNTFIDGCRQRQAELRREVKTAQLADSTFPAEQEGKVYLQQIGRAFLTLPPEQRAVLHLVAVEGLSYQEAADALGIPIGTLMSRLGRARAALRALDEGSRSQTVALRALLDRPARRNLRIVRGPNE